MVWSFSPVDPTSPVAEALLREYYVDIAGRYWGRPVTDEELAQVLLDEPSDDLTPPTGLLLAGSHDGGLAGCAGFRLLSPDTGEVTRVFLRSRFRGLGGGPALMAAVERAAGAVGVVRMRLDVRKDLVEARALYERCGYVEIPAYNDSPYAGHWYEKRIA